MANFRILSPSILWVLELCLAQASPNTLAAASADVTIPVISQEEYLNGWDLGNSVLHLVVETFLIGSKYVILRSVHREEGENCLANDQLEKKDPVRDALDFNNLLFTALLPTACQLRHDLTLVHKRRTWTCSPCPLKCGPGRVQGNLYTHVPAHHRCRLAASTVSTTSAFLLFRVPTFHVATLSLVLVLSFLVFFIFLVFVVVAVAILNKTHSRLFCPLEFYNHKLYKCLLVLSNFTGAKYDCPFHVYRLMSHNQYNIRDQPTPQEIEVHLRLLSSVYVPLGHSDRRILSCPPPSVCPP